MADTEHSFTREEIVPVIVVSLISALRLLGIFLMLPIFSVYAVRYPGASAALTGVAFGIYALIQSLFQIPLGWASDRWGRKPVLIIGLALFALGSVGCALATDIYSLILARALQGTGAVGSVAFAVLADLTRPSVRTQAYTITGIAIGSSFMVGLLAGPFLAAHIGLSGLFYLLAFLAFLSMILAATSFPTESIRAANVAPMALKPILLHHDLRPIFIATFALSFALNLFFFTYPLSWTAIGVEKSQLWQVYLIIFLPSVFFVFPYMRRAEKTRRSAGRLCLAGSRQPSATAPISSVPNTMLCSTSAAPRFFSATASISRSSLLFLPSSCRRAVAARRVVCTASSASSARRSAACLAAR